MVDDPATFQMPPEAIAELEAFVYQTRVAAAGAGAPEDAVRRWVRAGYFDGLRCGFNLRGQPLQWPAKLILRAAWYNAGLRCGLDPVLARVAAQKCTWPHDPPPQLRRIDPNPRTGVVDVVEVVPRAVLPSDLFASRRLSQAGEGSKLTDPDRPIAILVDHRALAVRVVEACLAAHEAGECWPAAEAGDLYVPPAEDA